MTVNLSLVLVFLLIGTEVLATGPLESQKVAAQAPTVSLEPVKDNTLYEDENGLLSNGAGQHFIAGKTGGDLLRRGVIAFDIAGNVPAGATIISASLKLNVSQMPSFFRKPELFSLHRLTNDWGEGASDAEGEEGLGIEASNNDATWLHTFYSSTMPLSGTLWTNQGGDFKVTESAATSVDLLGPYSWGPTPQMVADVQMWLDSPENNYGWLLLGNEAEGYTARRFDSRENPAPENRPVLTVAYWLQNYLPLIANE